MMRVKRNRSRRSFTLLEVLIALALAIALLGSVFTFYFNVMNTRARLLERSERYRAATTLIDRLEAELMVAVAGAGNLNEGVRGNATTLTVAGRGVAASLAERGTLAPEVFSDLQVTRYQFDERARQLELTRRAAGHDDTSRREVISGRIARVRFRYYDGTRWRSEYDSLDADALPHAVEVAIWFELPDDEQADVGVPGIAPIDEPVARNTFDADAGFDEFGFAMRDDRGFEDEPLPDRLRIIRIPDAAEEDVLSDGAGEPEAAP